MESRAVNGFQMKPIGASTLLVDRVADALRSAILNGELAPGSRLSVPDLARQLDVSRTPTREALVKLDHEGLVSLTPRRGAVVLSADTSDLEEILQFREALEGMAARLAARLISDEDLARLRREFEIHADAVRSGDVEVHVEHDRDFHRLLAAASGNKRIIAELERVRSQLQLITRAMAGIPGAVDADIIRAHERILEALEARDGRAAEAATRAHVRGVLNFYRSRRLAGAGADEGPAR